MATTFTKYTHLPKLLSTGAIDIDTDTIKCALVTSAYTPSAAHTQWADVSANEVATGDGYTTGGVTLTGVTVTNTAIDCADPSWAGLTKTFRYAVFYKSGSGGGLTNPLIGWSLLDDTPADIVISASTYTLIINASGLFTLS